MAFRIEKPTNHATLGRPAPAPRPRRRPPTMARAVAIAFAAILAVAAFAPLAMSHPGERSAEHRDAHRESARHDGSHADKRMDAERRAPKGNATQVQFTGSGLDRENRTYEVDGAGSLLCVRRENQTSGAEHVLCRGRLNVTLTDANGSIMRQGVVPVLLHAHQNETGEWTWHMLSVAHGKRATLVLALKGGMGDDAAGQLTLSEGKGGIMVKKSDLEARFKMRLADAEAVLQA